MDDQQLRKIIRETVQETFVAMGLPNDPIEAQRDFQHLRDWRKAVDAAKQRTFLATLALLGAGLIAAVTTGLKSFLSGP
jgi:hypothetical protein